LCLHTVTGRVTGVRSYRYIHRGKQVDGESEDPEEEERTNQSHRYGNHRNQRRTEVLQEDIHYDEHQYQGDDQGEVAKIELGGLQYNVNLLNDGQPAVMGMVQQIAGSNATQIASDVKKTLDELEKMSFVDRFHAGFNYQFEKITNKYKGGVKWVINHGVIAGSLVAVSIVGLVALMSTTKTGLVPDEDTGTLFACISTAPGTSQERTAEVVKQVDKMLANNPAIATRNAIMGYSFIGGAGSNQGTIIVKLKPFEERPGGFFHRIKEACTGGGIEALFVNPMEYTSVLGMIYKQTAAIKDAQVLAFAPPMISGFSVQNGITMTMQDKTGGDLNKFYDNVKKFLAELNKRPEIQTAQTQYNPNYPQYMVDVDVAKTKQAGISPSSVLSVMQGYLGGLYASNFNAYGKLYRVMIQAGPESRMRPDELSKIYVRCSDGTMSPVSEFVTLKKIYGPSNITRFNLFTSMDVSVTPNTGYSTGDGMKAIAEVAKETLPEGYGYEYSGLTRSEAESSNSTGLIFALCIVFVYLILSAQYESYILPLSVVLSIPFGLAGSFIFTNLFGHSNDIYMQISLIMLIGLLAKNAILIVQFALERRRTGMAIKYSAILGAGARLRPILMTSLAMVIGLLPLMFASGVGKNGNQTLGAAAVGGMLIGTICQIFVVPALFAVFQWLQEKLTPPACRASTMYNTYWRYWR
jgi:hydrophobic/amphiphilic exporter-1 (mainly G- bacteria), HAE1 family